ncbi:MAG TPA: ROK family protein [Hyphomicrobiales bacterium]|nr:ROK family protein [Hyphomicrobiales bacterium]
MLADIGGTNARFARSDPDGGIGARRAYKVAEFTDFESALQAYLDDTSDFEPCTAAAVGAAGPVLDGDVRLTNAPWRISEAGLSRLLGGMPVCLVNDTEAVALALPRLRHDELKSIGEVGEAPSRARRMLALNVGTGFNAATVIPVHGRWFTCPSEAGHMSFAAQGEAERALLGGGDTAAVTVEDALSGDGLMRIYRAACRSLGSEPAAADSQKVFAGAGIDAAATETLRLFTIWLGQVARDLALATAAWGGVYLTGGVVHGWCAVASASLFRASFESSDKMRERLLATPTAAIIRDDAALVGLAHAPLD